VDNVLAEIKKAESDAANTVALAKEKAAAIIDGAKAKCTEIADSKIKAAHSDAEKALENAKTEAEKIYADIISEYNTKCLETEKAASANISAAADAIIKNLI
jgi:vacuolar-type H+-ATPase subunit H